MAGERRLRVAAIRVNTKGEGGRVRNLVTSPLLLPVVLLITIDVEREGWCIESLITLLLLPPLPLSVRWDSSPSPSKSIPREKDEVHLLATAMEGFGGELSRLAEGGPAASERGRRHNSGEKAWQRGD